MREETPIAKAGIGGRAEVLAGPPAALQKVGIFAGRFRWVICGLLFLGVTKNYMDRQVLGVLKSPRQQEVGWYEIDYGNSVVAVLKRVATGMSFVGRLI